MQAIWDFLSFKSMVSIDALVVFYYLGAVGVPIVLPLVVRWLLNKLGTTGDALKEGGKWSWQQLSLKYQLWVVGLSLGMFFLMELFWRMLFEYLIAFMQMRDALISVY